MTKKISVLVPTYNRARYISQCIESVLDQSFKDFEIIVVDDGSTDNTKEILRSFGRHISYFYQENKGIPSARNSCVEKSNCPLLAFIDSDDVWCKDKLERQYEYLLEHKEVDIVFSPYKNFLDGGDPEQQAVKDELSFDSRTCMVSALIKKELFNKYGLFSELLKTGEDSEWVMRLALNGVDTRHCLDEFGFYRRIHSSNSFLNPKAKNIDVLRVLAKTVRQKVMTKGR